MNVCYECFGPSATLRATFGSGGEPGWCDGCQRKRKRVLDAADLEDLFARLASVYEVAQPGEHFYSVRDEGEVIEGGDTGEKLPELLQQEWPIFREGMERDTIDSILESAWPDYDSSSGYASRTLWHRDPDYDWEQLKNHLKHQRRFFVDASTLDISPLPVLLKQHMRELRTVTKGGIWFRARIQESVKTPHAPCDMLAPPAHKATAGRANPAGISYLYLCASPVGACAEVRAEPGDPVTIAEFKVKGELKLLDLVAVQRGIDPFAPPDLRTQLTKVGLVRAFASDLSQPVRASDAHIDYVPTQYLAEFFISHGFDGIRYRSAVTDAVNLVLFSTEKAVVRRTGTVVVTRKELTVRSTNDEEGAAPFDIAPGAYDGISRLRSSKRSSRPRPR